MARFIRTGKGKRRALAVAAALSAALTLGVFAACAEAPAEEEETESSTSSATDTQLLKNGNFEFYDEMDEEDVTKKLDLINSPTSWSFTSGSPSSDTASGIVDVTEWDYLSKSGRPLTSPEDALANWTDEAVTAYDRLSFYKESSVSSASDFSLYSDYTYSIDFEDVQYLHEVEGGPGLHDADKQTESGDTSVLMIHNRRSSDGVRGTAQYYTSGTTITVPSGGAAEISVWVKTSNLYHYASGNDVEVEKRGGAYIGVTNTVGGTTLDQLQIRNINTKNVTENNGWKQYTVYVRANTFAATTFRIVLGLGQGNSDDRYDAVDGYAFFDDVTCKLISDAAFAEKTNGVTTVGIEDRGDARKFDAVDRTTGAFGESTFALDLKTDLSAFTPEPTELKLTADSADSKFNSAYIDSSLGDNRTDETVPETRRSVLGVFSLAQLRATDNGYLKNIVEEDFAKFPFANTDGILTLLSTNGAAYTAVLPDRTLAPHTRELVSFFVKTSDLRSGASGAGAVLVDGENKTAISPFNSTTVAKVDIDLDDEELTDIYDGWVRCIFFVENDTNDDKTYHLELTYGPTAIEGTDRGDYCDGYAAFANFETSSMSKKLYGYAATGSYMQKVSLTANVKDSSSFDAAAASGTRIEDGLARPANYMGVLAGSRVLDRDGAPNPSASELARTLGVYTGLLSSEYVKNYRDAYKAAPEDETTRWMGALNALASEDATDDAWWTEVFGNKGTRADAAYQPLVILNTSDKASPSYGFFASNATFSANTATRITVRVKLSANAKAYLYLTDVSDLEEGFGNRLSPTLPSVTYWYDDEGNITAKDPSSSDYNAKTDILYYLEENGLYTKAGANDNVYYANLKNFKTDDEGNKTTADGTIAFYGKQTESGTLYYAYKDETTGALTQEVKDLPADAGVRYNYSSALPETVLTVQGSDVGSDGWVTVSFLVNTGAEAKSYRLELWAGARDDAEGLPAGGYVFFDRCSTSTVDNYSDLLSAAESALLKDEANRAPDPADPSATLKDRLKEELALYYTFTFFDSPDYLRYDKTTDEDNLGDPWGSYVQSAYEEGIAYLFCADPDGSVLKANPSYTMFVSFAENEKTVTPDELGGDDTPDVTEPTQTNPNAPNVWLLISSGVLAFVLVFVIIAVAVRRIWKRTHKNSSKPAKKRVRKTAEKAPKAEAPAPAPAPAPEPEPEAPADENDPYRE